MTVVSDRTARIFSLVFDQVQPAILPHRLMSSGMTCQLFSIFFSLLLSNGRFYVALDGKCLQECDISTEVSQGFILNLHQ